MFLYCIELCCKYVSFKVEGICIYLIVFLGEFEKVFIMFFFVLLCFFLVLLVIMFYFSFKYDINRFLFEYNLSFF